jgi:hypothetical protein
MGDVLRRADYGTEMCLRAFLPIVALCFWQEFPGCASVPMGVDDKDPAAPAM